MAKEKGRGKGKARAPVADRAKALDLALASIERQYGKGTVMRLGEKGKLLGQIGVIPTGSLGLDAGLGIGGYPRGRVIEIYGPEASGKTTLALHAIAEAQKLKGIALFIDAEHALDITYARKLGVNVDDLLIHQPDNGEQALEVADTMVRSNAVDVIVVDSVAALTPRAELEGEMGDSHVGLQARLMSQAMRKLAANVAKSKTLLIFINQIRMKIGVMFGSPETTTGGNALKFYSTQRLDIRRIATIKQGDTVTGGRARVKVVKNKLSPPFREAEFDIVYGKGINRLGELVDIGVRIGAIEKTGAWFTMGSSLGGERIGQGRDNAVSFFEDNPDLAEKVEAAIREKAGLPLREQPDSADDEADS
jgi:recombination protein RecA